MTTTSTNLKVKPMGLADWAYEQIKENILNLVYQPGSQLEVERLAAEMGISRTPIREALLRLERDGLVQVISRVGFFATDISARDLEELYELRELLESRAVRDSIPCLSKAEIDCLKRVVGDTAAAIEQGDHDRFIASEIEFHAILTEHAPNQRLVATLESFKDLTYRWRILSTKSPDYMHTTLNEHQAIFDAVKHRDAELACQLMSDHINNAKNRISEVVSQFSSSKLLPGNGRKTKSTEE
jgi:DNA-binding GntR family transcriptional regulator